MRQALCRERYAIFAPFILRFFKTFLIAAGKVNTFAVIRRRYLILLFENPAEMFRRSVSDHFTDSADGNTGRFQKLFPVGQLTVLNNFRKGLPRLSVYQYFWRRKRKYNFYGQIKTKEQTFRTKEAASRNPGDRFLPVREPLKQTTLYCGAYAPVHAYYIFRNARYPFTASYTSALLDTS